MDAGKFEQDRLKRFNFLANRAQAHLGLNEFAAAIPILAEAVNIYPDDANAWFAMGHALANSDKPQEASQCYQNALSLEPTERRYISRFVISLMKSDLSKLDNPLAKRAFHQLFIDWFKNFPGLEPTISPVVKFADWQSRHSAQVLSIDPEQEISLSDEKTGFRDLYVADQTSVANVTDANVIAGWDYIVTSSGEVIDGSGYQPIDVTITAVPHIYSKPANLVLHGWRSEQDVIEESAFFLSAPQGNNFGHWIIDFLPRLRAWESLASIARLKVAVPSNLPSRHRDLLQRFGVGEADIIELEYGKRYLFKSLWVAQQSHRNLPQRERILFLRERLFFSSRDTERSLNPKRVFLERSGSGRGRNVVNQEDVNAILREYQFESVKLAEHSIAEQGALLRDTEIVIATFGTDLVSMFHFRPGTTVIILVHENTTVSGIEADIRANERYCAMIGMHPRRVVCLSVEDGIPRVIDQAVSVKSQGRSPFRRELFYRDMVVDCGNLRQTINEALKDSE